MSSAAARSLMPSTSPFRIMLLSGEHKGVAFELISSGITIGRAPENDIVLANDLKCSRHHARVSLTPNGIEVVDISQKNKIEVDGALHEKAMLLPGSVFIVGSTQMRLDHVDATRTGLTQGGASRSPLSTVPTGPNTGRTTPRTGFTPPPTPAGLPPLPHYTRPASGVVKSSPGGGANRLVFYGLILLIGAGVWLITSGTVKKPEDIPLGGAPEVIESRLEEFEKRKELIVKSSEKEGPRNQQWREAQSLYLQGFRDYKKGQYSRAIESLRGALSIYPSHQLASRYLALARRRSDEMMQKNMTRAREYREKNMYQKCAAYYVLAMSMINDQASPLYKEAKIGLDECQLHLEGRY